MTRTHPLPRSTHTPPRSNWPSTASAAGAIAHAQGVDHDPADASAFYDRWAGLYDLIASHAPLVDRLRRRAVDALRLERGDTVLEIGCGSGANLPLLAEAVGPRGTVVGIDRAPGILQRARRNVRGYPQVEMVRADATSLPIENGDAGAGDGALDGVLATFVVGMLDEPAVAVEDWIDHLDPEGHVALLHFQRSEHAIAPLANAALGLATVLSTPPTTKLRYERDLLGELDARTRAAGEVVRDRTEPTLTESHLFDLIELTAGKRA